LNFPAVHAFQPRIGGITNAFVAKLNADGSALVYSSYLGGSQSDVGIGIAVDPAGNAWVSGTTDSPNFPTTPGAHQPSPGGGSCGPFGPCQDAFVVKISPQ